MMGAVANNKDKKRKTMPNKAFQGVKKKIRSKISMANSLASLERDNFLVD